MGAIRLGGYNLNRWGWARAENYDKTRTTQFKRRYPLAIRTGQSTVHLSGRTRKDISDKSYGA